MNISLIKVGKQLFYDNLKDEIINLMDALHLIVIVMSRCALYSLIF